jgi:hypothetical protein
MRMKTPLYAVKEIDTFIDLLNEAEISILLEVVDEDAGYYEPTALQHIYTMIMVRLKDLQQTYASEYLN